MERELEKVNTFYLQKEGELKIRLEILVQKKQSAYDNGELFTKTSVSYISLYEAFQRFGRDLERLEQFIELNATGFSKVLKKWDKRSKSHTKELYLSRAVEVQPVFHREELAHFSDLAASSMMDLESWSEGDSTMYEASNTKSEDVKSKPHLVSRKKDDLFHEFVRTASEGDPVEIKKCIERLQNTDDAGERITRIFLLAISSEASDNSLIALWETKCVDIHSVDDISGKNCLHRAAATDNHGRVRIVQLALEEKVDVNQADVYGKVPLHYACLHNRRDLIFTLLKAGANINALDKDNFSPLLYSILYRFTGCVSDLVNSGANVDVDSAKDYVPLNFACQYGVYDAVKILIEKYPNLIVADAEGLYPIHLVARAGHANLVPLLKSYGVNVNELDKLNQWTALFYAASEGHFGVVKALLEANADPFILDENGRTALFYAAWEGRPKCLHALAAMLPVSADGKRVDASRSLQLEARAKQSAEPIVFSPMDLTESSAEDEMIDDIDAIPDLSLPPPIIPLRRYGHNFLDKKIVLQLLFDPNKKPLKFLKEEDGVPAGRLTISARNSNDFIPRSLMLPVGDGDRVVTFQVDSLRDFILDFEVYSTFGTRIIAKATALPYVFQMGEHSTLSMDHVYRLPLTDSRLTAIGEISFRFQVVMPFQGKPLEITKYDTYWKSTSQVGQGDQSVAWVTQEHVSESLSFVTASSLSGKFSKIGVCLTRDFVPVISYSWFVKLAGIQIPIGNLDCQQLMGLDNIKSRNETVFSELENITDADQVYEVIKDTIVPLSKFLKHLPLNIKLDAEVLYPTASEAALFSFGISSFCELNQYADHILRVLFNHAHEVRKANGVDTGVSRSLIFTSSNPDVCTVLNWKQPNYPVFFNIDALRLDGKYQTAHGLVNVAQKEDRRCVSLKDGASFASNNNLFGIICSASLLNLVPSLVSSVRVLGLVLVSSGESHQTVDGADATSSIRSVVFKGNIDM